MFITLEGGDGCGKSTQARLLAETLRSAGHEVVLTREPGGSPGAERIRSLVLQDDTLSPESTLLLFTAARRDHVENTIRPALAAGKIVICDRYVDSSRVYQGLDNPVARSRIDALHQLMIALDPDLTLIFDIDGDTADARRTIRDKASDRFEVRPREFHDGVRAGFRAIVAEHPGRCRLLDAGRSIREVSDMVLASLPETLLAPLLADLPQPG
ncbi:dTMP kinase [Paracoccus sp. ME4]|uniref:dTMP kinase n=1 Tax=Paracoccus sp. ME4 TaxID=3138066 RepID=UPI00398A8D8D